MFDDCPDENVLTQIVEGRLAGAELHRLHAHIDGCRACAELLVELGRLDQRTATSEQVPPASASPALVGRYEVLDVLGRGGMGTVYLAFDPELDRKVALKVLHVGNDRAQERLLREARAMARLSHPNVVQVHEVGSFVGGRFIAMELVEGGTLKSWATGRPSKDVLRACIDAGRGLQAAHAAGLVHRDFKPANVLCDAQGRSRVTDFGLVSSPSESLDESQDAPSRRSASPQTLDTRTGAVLGTPAYMAPEQARGEPADERADQFAFCVTTWQVVSGTHPFGSGRPGPVPPKWPDDGPAVRGAVIDVLCRGLRIAPEQRWASMSELLEALQGSIAPRRWPWLLVPALGLAAWGGVEGAAHQRRLHAEQRCEQLGHEIDDLWDETSREAVRQGLTNVDVPFATSVADRVPQWLDARAKRWREQTTQACRNAEVDQRWDDDTYQRARRCLREQQIEFEILLDDFVAADVQIAVGAVQSAAAPPRLGTCLNEVVLRQADGAPPTSTPQSRDAVQRQLVRARTMIAQRRFDDGLVAARAAKARAHSDGLPRLALAAQAEEVVVLYVQAHYDDGAALAKATYMSATSLEHWDIAMHSARTMMHIVGFGLRRRPEAELWAELTEVAIGHAGDALGQHEAQRLASLAAVRRVAGDLDGAYSLASKSLDAVTHALGSRHPRVAEVLSELGQIKLVLGEYAAAQDYLERALSILQDALGPSHPMLADTLTGLGTALAQQGVFDESKRVLTRARVILEEAREPLVRLTPVLSTLAGLALYTGDMDAAKPLYDRVLEIELATVGPDHPSVAGTLSNLGVWHINRREYLQARSYFERALAIANLDIESRGESAAMSLNNLALTYYGREEYEEAATRYAEAQQAYERAMGAKHPTNAAPLTSLGQVLSRLNREAEAIGYLERALRLRTENATPIALLAFTQFAMAEVLWSAEPSEGRDRERAIALAETAATAFASDGAGSVEELAQARAWLDERR